MESRLCLSVGTQVPASSGVDSIAMGDVNGDQIADVAVASQQNGQYQVAIYNGAGQADDEGTQQAMPPGPYKNWRRSSDPFSTGRQATSTWRRGISTVTASPSWRSPRRS